MGSGGRAVAVVAACGTAVVTTVAVAMLVRLRPPPVWHDLFLGQNAPAAVVLLWTGWLVLRRRPGHGAGRVLVAIGLLLTLHVAVALAVDVRLVGIGIPEPITAGPLTAMPQAALPPDIATGGWVMGWLWVPPAVLTVVVLPLLFPDGRLPRGGRLVLAAAAAGAAQLVAALAIISWPRATWLDDDAPVVTDVLLATGGLTVAAAIVSALVGLVARARCAAPDGRGPYRLVGGSLLVLAVPGVAAYPWPAVWAWVLLVAANVQVVAYALAVGRYRLHGVEPFLGRAALPTIAGAAAVLAHLAAVVLLAGAVAAWTASATAGVLVATVTAPLAEPVRRVARSAALRGVQHRRVDRTEVLSVLADRARVPGATAQLLSEVAVLLLRGTGAVGVEVGVGPQGAERYTASAGECARSAPVLRGVIDDGDGPSGEVRLHAWAAADLVPDASRLVRDVAHTLATVLRRDALDASLREHVEELRASRRRLLEEHDRARRGLERDVHDGAQSRLIALRLRVTRLHVMSDDPRLLDELDRLAADADAAVRSLRELARGLYPAPLERSGIVQALRAGVRDLPVPVDVEASGVGRHRAAVESGTYFACMEAVQNAVRHSGADRVVVRLEQDGTVLRFSVRDDGRGFDPERAVAGSGLSGIGDRVAALGGRARVLSTPGAGTDVLAEIPILRGDATSLGAAGQPADSDR